MTDSFHTFFDAKVLPLIGKPRLGGSISEQVRVTTRNRTLSYRFYPHFHPYVEELVGQLVTSSVNGLQTVDTKYCLLATLSDGCIATTSSGAQITLSAGTSARLIAGTVLTLGGDTALRVSGNRLVTCADGKMTTLAKGTSVTVSSGTAIETLVGKALTLQQAATLSLSDGQPRPVLSEEIFTADRYDPDPVLVPNTPDSPHPLKDLDFTSSGAYSVYNWELFYHLPLTVALHLTKNQRFADAQQWLHYVFDPTDDSDGPTPERFWKVKPFQTTDVKRIEEILVNLSTGVDEKLRKDTINSINAWKEAPFRPHLVARYRQSAYMFKAVMAYLDNLIDWGDSLYRQDTRETVNEALQLYVLAANILGPRPQAVPKKGSVRPQTYANLRQDLDKLGNALRELEADIPFDLAPRPRAATELTGQTSLGSFGKTLYFGVPRNDKLSGYWDTVADRLYKIRNSLNIQGIFRQLPLFEPPIDPGLLAKAAAAGLDIGAILTGLNQPLPLVRFQVLVQKAAEICQEVKSLGNGLLAAIEKEDNELLAILRAKHERVLLGLAETVKYAQWQEAIKSREALETSFDNAAQRFIYYERLLDEQQSDVENKTDTARSSLGDLETDGFEKSNTSFASKEPTVELRSIAVDIAHGVFENDLAGGKKLSQHELDELRKLEEAQEETEAATHWDKAAGGMAIVPDFEYAYKPMGSGWSFRVGRANIIAALQFVSSFYKAEAQELTFEAGKSAKTGSYATREREYAFQSNLAAGEMTQILKQLRAAQIREYSAKRDWTNHQQQVRHAEEIEYFMTGEKNKDWAYKISPKQSKSANKALYGWMKRETKGLYGQCFQLAFDVAKKAERALQHELGDPSRSYLQFGYLDGNQGLLAGEKLYLDIKRMEMAYHDLNQREYEITKHVSLRQVDPIELLKLRATGSCSVELPESLFDMDCPGHYFRRIKSVALTIPCVTGPYTGVNCTLTLLSSAIRKSARLLSDGAGNGYARTGPEDDRFSDYYGSLQSIVGSSGQNDSGLFETNLRDERYLPFEYSGAIGKWQLSLPADPSKKEPCQFDYDTISDVILHIRYTAREGGSLLRKKAMNSLEKLINEAEAAGSVRLFSVRHDFPSAWAEFKAASIPAKGYAKLALDIKAEHYPFWSGDSLNVTKSIELIAKGLTNCDVKFITDGKATVEELNEDTRFGTDCVSTVLTSKPLPKPFGQFDAFLSHNSMKELFIAVIWAKA
ncbi:Tc toxin subunit A-related protein [Thiocapsa bogorovii]|uniref:Tc toxin subunit A-related protein n=1 Tax=Thiocapsa bogorovii TaxID=521689 RepID=UPI001E57289F|nr:hypothetical protein [Thiocapsa bogorovii]UHD15039.1 hypothetical protein LT988_17365 [Thiocapsa bogorovii]